LHLGRFRVGLARERAVRGVGADVLGQNLFELQPESLKPRAQNLVGGARLRVRIRPSVDERADGFKARRVADLDF
jgi:hypothetical protein